MIIFKILKSMIMKQMIKIILTFKVKNDELMIQHIQAVSQNETINDLKTKYSIGYNLIKSKH